MSLVKTHQQQTTMKRFIADDKFDEVIRQLTDRGWRRHTDSDGDRKRAALLWTNLRSVDFDHGDWTRTWVNHLRGSQHLSNKAFLAYHLHRSGLSSLPLTWSPAWQSVPELAEMLFQQSVRSLAAVPASAREERAQRLRELRAVLGDLKSSLVGNDVYQRYCEELQRAEHPIDREEAVEGDVWIVKPVGLSCGEKISLTRRLLDTLSMAKTFSYKCIVQKYIERPLLVRGNRKFDIRQWVLVTSLRPLTVFGFSECYLRLSSEPYSLDTAEDLQSKFIHLCNHAIQRQSNTDSHGEEDVCETMMTQSDFDRELSQRFGRENGVFHEKVLPQIQRISIETLYATRDKMEKVGKGFEWLGLDLMVREDDLAVQLIEVNVSPDISLSTSVTTPLVRHAVGDLMTLLFDEYDESLPHLFRRADVEETNGSLSIPRWQCWHAEQLSPEVIDAKKTIERNAKGAYFRPDCKPLFASVGEKVIQTLTKMKQQCSDHDSSCQSVEDDDDEL